MITKVMSTGTPLSLDARIRLAKSDAAKLARDAKLAAKTIKAKAESAGQIAKREKAARFAAYMPIIERALAKGYITLADKLNRFCKSGDMNVFAVKVGMTVQATKTRATWKIALPDGSMVTGSRGFVANQWRERVMGKTGFYSSEGKDSINVPDMCLKNPAFAAALSIA